MVLRFPKRFTTNWWIAVTSIGSALGLAAVALLWRLGYLSSNHLVVWGLLAVVVGDLVAAAALESIAPTEITLEPGERTEKNAESALSAKVVSGFAGAKTGYVTVKGESWAAQLVGGDPRTVTAGDIVKIAGRNGLTLKVVANNVNS